MNTIDKINYYLAKQGKNGAGLCAYLGVSNGVYSQWNTGRTSPRKSKLPLIAEYLGVTVEDLLPDESIKKQPSIPKDEELNKNDAVWDLREAVLERFPAASSQEISALLNAVEGNSSDLTIQEIIAVAEILKRMTPADKKFLEGIFEAYSQVK